MKQSGLAIARSVCAAAGPAGVHKTLDVLLKLRPVILAASELERLRDSWVAGGLGRVDGVEQIDA